MVRRKSNVYVGIAGWSYPDWEGIVYPARRNFKKLKFLAQFFQSIEVNSTFYRIPSQRTTEQWCQDVEEEKDFTFTVKLLQDFTHTRGNKKEAESKSLLFKSALRPLARESRLGAVLIQFPHAFHFNPENLDPLRRLFVLLGDLPLVVEVRHRSFQRPEFFEFLRKHHVGFVNIDQPPASYSMPLSMEVTASIGYVRFHGRNASAWFKQDATRNERYDYSYSLQELLEWIRRVERISEIADRVYVIFNNHFRGQEVTNALEFLHLWYERPVRVPSGLKKAFPQLEKIATPDSPLRREGPEILPLFPD